jgi:hypothetical protein
MRIRLLCLVVLMIDLDLCLSVGVLCGLSLNDALVRTDDFVISHLCGFTTIPLPLLPFFWVFFI